MTAITSSLIALIMLTLLAPSAQLRNPCQRSNNVTFAKIAAELSKMKGCFFAGTPCGTQTEPESVPDKDLPTKYIVIWTKKAKEPPVFDVVLQSDILKNAEKLIAQNIPSKSCNSGRKKGPVSYRFTTAQNGDEYWISMRVTYACCAASSAPTPEVKPGT